MKRSLGLALSLGVGALGCAHRSAGPATRSGPSVRTSPAAAPVAPPAPGLLGGALTAPLEGSALDFELPRYPTKKLYRLSEDRGAVILVDVWATWCEPCRDALPAYQSLAERYGPKGLKVYALNVDEDPREVPPFLKATQLALPVLLDPDAELAERTLHVRVMPTTFLVDRRGVVRHVHEGFTSTGLAEVRAEVETLLAEPGR